MKLYVGNLPYTTTDESLREIFEPYGAVESATVVMDRITGKSKGFGFVEMPDADAQKAIAALNGRQVAGRALKVDSAKPRESGGGGGGGGRGGRGGGGGGYGGGGRDRY